MSSRLTRLWFNQTTNDRGRPLDLHSLSLHHEPNPAFSGEPSPVVTQTQLPTRIWATNMGLFSTSDLRLLQTQLDEYLTKVDPDHD